MSTTINLKTAKAPVVKMKGGFLTVTGEILKYDGTVEKLDDTRELRIIYILPEKMVCDPLSQRGVITSHVASIKENFDIRAVKPFLVNIEPDGIISLLDGQQEREVLLDLGFKQWICEVRRGLDFKQKCKLLADRNEQKPMTEANKFRNRLNQEKPEALALRDLVRGEGFDMKIKGHPLENPDNLLTSFKAVYGIYGTYPADVLRNVLRFLKRQPSWSFGGMVQRRARASWLMQGLAQVFGEDRLTLEQVLKGMENVSLDAFISYIEKNCKTHGRYKDEWTRYYVSSVRCGLKVEQPKKRR